MVAPGVIYTSCHGVTAAGTIRCYCPSSGISANPTGAYALDPSTDSALLQIDVNYNYYMPAHYMPTNCNPAVLPKSGYVITVFSRVFPGVIDPAFVYLAHQGPISASGGGVLESFHANSNIISGDSGAALIVQSGGVDAVASNVQAVMIEGQDLFGRIAGRTALAAHPSGVARFIQQCLPQLIR
jgi:hypothetical protein